MDTFMGRYRNVTILAAAIFLQILGLAVQIRRPAAGEENPSASSRLIRLWAVSIVAPLEKGIVRVQTSASGVWHNYFYLRGVRKENRDLKDQIEQLRLEQVRLKQDADQAHRLQTLLGFKEQFVGETKAAQVIGSSGSEQSRLVYIDKGSDDGLKPEMPVITPDGVIGKVLTVVDGSTSQVLLINDQQSGVGAIVEQSRLQGVLKGRASGELVIDKIMADEEVKPGDRILTSGGDRIFPKGLPIGTVAKVAKGTEFLQLTVKPAASLNHLEEVLVITKKEQHEAPALSPAPSRAADILAQRLPQVPEKPAASNTGTAAPPGAAQPATARTQASATTTPVNKPVVSENTAGAAASVPAIKNPAAAVSAGSVTNSALTPGMQPKPAVSDAPVVKKPVSTESSLVPNPSTAPPAQSKPTTAPSAQSKPSPKTDAPAGTKLTDTKTAETKPAASKPAEPKPVAPAPNPSQDTPQ